MIHLRCYIPIPTASTSAPLPHNRSDTGKFFGPPHHPLKLPYPGARHLSSYHNDIRLHFYQLYHTIPTPNEEKSLTPVK
jgi:hypothetical protein